MPRLSRKFRVCKWAGTVGCVLIVAAFLWSVGWSLDVVWNTESTHDAFQLACGCVGFSRSTMSQWGIPGWRLLQASINEPWGFDIIGLPSLTLQPPSDYEVVLPLWLPFLVLLIPTLLLWRRDRRRRRPGFCYRCEYDLTGNASGRCPECGLEIAA